MQLQLMHPLIPKVSNGNPWRLDYFRHFDPISCDMAFYSITHSAHSSPNYNPKCVRFTSNMAVIGRPRVGGVRSVSLITLPEAAEKHNQHLRLNGTYIILASSGRLLGWEQLLDRGSAATSTSATPLCNS